MPSKKLNIVQSPDQCKKQSDSEVYIAVDELLGDVPISEYDEAYERLRHSDLPDIAGVPLYRMLWQRFAVPFNGFPDNPTGISHLIVFYSKLTSLPDIDDISTIDCHDVDPCYRAVATDFAENNGIDVLYSTRSHRHRLLGFARGMLSLFFVVIDAFLSLFVRYLFDFNKSADVVFVPHLNRFEAMRPVLDAADYKYAVVAPVSTVEWIYHRYRGQWADSAEYSPVPIGAYTSLSILMREIALFFRLSVSELVHFQFKRDLKELVEREFNVHLDHTLDRALGNTYPNNLGPIPNLWLSKQLYRTLGAEKVVIGSLSLRQQTFLFSAESEGLQSYHVPHTVPTHYDTIPKTEMVHFVPSVTSLEYHEDADFLCRDSHPIVAIGRPLLTSLAKQRPPAEPVREPVRIVIATQPFDDHIRHEFVSKILEHLLETPIEFDIIIKTHPIEDPSFYAEFERRWENVTVTDADLHDRLEAADLTFVVNTNVGLESIALGTPTVAVNLWEPFTNTRPYQDRGPVPLLRTGAELDEFIAELDLRTINELRNEQIEFFDEQYFGDAEVSEAIAEYVHEGQGEGLDSPQVAREAVGDSNGWDRND